MNQICLAVLQLSFTVWTVVAYSDIWNTGVMALVYNYVKQLLSFMSRSPSSGGNNNCAWVPVPTTTRTILPHTMNTFSRMAKFNTSMEYINMFSSALLWSHAAHPLWIYLQRQEIASPLVYYIIACGGYFNYGCNTSTTPEKCVVPHRFGASNPDSGTKFASDTIYVSVPCCSVITPEDVSRFTSKETEPDAVTP